MARARPRRMQHFAIEVSDTDRSVDWYRNVLGFKVTERHAAHEVAEIPVELTFMRLGDVHHEIVLVHNPAKTYRRKPLPENDLGWTRYSRDRHVPVVDN
ncbi:MAG: VOC family protein [Rhodobacter sp.]|nr:VOC family protein [Rhodobacter sp.]